MTRWGPAIVARLPLLIGLAACTFTAPSPARDIPATPVAFSVPAIRVPAGLDVPHLRATATSRLRLSFDEVNGGFHGTPRRPDTARLRCLLRWHDSVGEPDLLAMIHSSLSAWTGGQLRHPSRGDYHEACLGQDWTQPTSHRRLIDQACMAIVLAEARQMTGHQGYGQSLQRLATTLLMHWRLDGGLFVDSFEGKDPVAPARTGSNGLAIAALSRAGRVLNNPELIRQAGVTATFLNEHLTSPTGWLRAWDGRDATLAADGGDHAGLLHGMTELYLATGDSRWLLQARDLADTFEQRFMDADGHLIAPGPEPELTRSLAAGDALRLARLLGDPRLATMAARLMIPVASEIRRAPEKHPLDLLVLEQMHGPRIEVVLEGHPHERRHRDLRSLLHNLWLPNLVWVERRPDDQQIEGLVPWLRHLGPPSSGVRLRICRDGHSGSACVELSAAFEELRRQRR